MEEDFIAATGRHENYRLALSKLRDEVNLLLKKGYAPIGSMLHLREKEATDTFTVHVFIQPMLFIN